MVRLSTRRQKCNNWNEDETCPNIVKRIKILTFESRTCKAYQSTEGEYEVKDGKSMLLVSLNKKTCLCGAWKIPGLPCKHAIRAILAAGLNPYKFCSTWFSVQTYKQAYVNSIHTVPDFEHWPEIDMPTILPPQMKRGIGRPSRQRRRAPDEPDKGKRSTTVQCQRCMCYGHNKQTCKGGLIAAEQSDRDGHRIAKKTSESTKRNAPKSTSTSNPPNPPRRFTRSSLQSVSQPHALY
ncbi:uncharacterized protein LOC110696448 [Chenopodium quinoa]|uniref:uncharacterized protein LOC110696448 n=1 Tax=Chenopodium quinoa TaxID=63459 RepID=UPI000B76DECE|nr:uncharacterized protein LOC110696448 [Chenopodium quinoa]